MLGRVMGNGFHYNLFYCVRYKWVSPVVVVLLHVVVFVMVCVGPLPRHDLHGIARPRKEMYWTAEDASWPQGVSII